MAKIRFILDPRDGTIIQPRRMREHVGRMEYRIERTETYIRGRFTSRQVAALLEWLAQPLRTREERKYPNVRLPLTDEEKAQRRKFMRRMRGQTDRAKPVKYFYDKQEDDAVKHGSTATTWVTEDVDDGEGGTYEVTTRVDTPFNMPTNRVWQIEGTGDDAHRVPADNIDDGRYVGPMKATEARALIEQEPPTEPEPQPTPTPEPHRDNEVVWQDGIPGTYPDSEPSTDGGI